MSLVFKDTEKEDNCILRDQRKRQFTATYAWNSPGLSTMKHWKKRKGDPSHRGEKTMEEKIT